MTTSFVEIARRAAAALAALAVLAASQRAAAQPATMSLEAGADAATNEASGGTAARDKRDAHEHFLRGLALAKQSSWGAALTEFESSITLHPTRAATMNAAFCLTQLGRFADALALYEKLRADQAQLLTAEEQSRIGPAIAELEAMVGAIELVANVSGARVEIDGRLRGTTPLAPLRVDRGVHHLRVSHPDFNPFVVDVAVSGRERRAVVVTLTPLSRPLAPLAEPAARPPERPRAAPFPTGRLIESRATPAAQSRYRVLGVDGTPSVELLGGLLLGSSLGGAADASCDHTVTFSDGRAGAGCVDHSRPLGGLAALRAGYRLESGFGVDVALGYFRVRDRQVRRVEVTTENPGLPLTTDRLQDSTRLSAPFLALAASQRFFRRLPLTLRLATGLALATVHTGVDGELSGQAPLSSNPAQLAAYSGRFVLAEEPRTLVIPFLAPELRFGYRVSSRLLVDVGVSGWLLFAPARPRGGGAFGTSEQRVYRLPDQGSGDERVVAGLATLPREDSLGLSLLWLSSLGLELTF